MRTLSLSIRPISLVLLILMVSNVYSLRSNPIYITQSDSYHIVARGETLYGISRKYSVPVERLKLFNNLEDDKIIVGQKIYLTPSITAKREYVTTRSIPEKGYHLVLRGETVYRISKMYDLEIMDILSYNNLETFDIQAGQKIWLIPGKIEQLAAAPVPDRPVTEDAPAIEPAPQEQQADVGWHIVSRGENLYRISLKYGMTVAQLRELNALTSDEINVGQRLKVIGGAKIAAAPAPTITRPPAVTGTHKKGSIHLPLQGQALSEFGIRNNMPHNGIDIGAATGEPIYAALNGKVVFVGVQRGYGNVVVLEHENYIMTVYAHNERNLVRLGDQVTKGQPIATVGQTGNASAPHLHFEYRVRGRAINPREVLPDF